MVTGGIGRRSGSEVVVEAITRSDEVASVVVIFASIGKGVTSKTFGFRISFVFIAAGFSLFKTADTNGFG